VKGQSAAFLEKSRELLDDADAILTVDRHEAAARTAYMAGFHAAQALIFESSGRIYKTHSGVQSEFNRLAKDDARVDNQIRAFLGRTYNLKAIADYLTGPGSHISAESAREAIDGARRFVECLTSLMPAQQADLSLAERSDTPPTDEADHSREPDHEQDDDLER
jgi:uncharacterized protein (UPF0332 family)